MPEHLNTLMRTLNVSEQTLWRALTCARLYPGHWKQLSAPNVKVNQQFYTY